MKILLVEDHPALADISVRLLRDVHGHVVRNVTTGAATLAAALALLPDIILIDLNLPDTTGYAVAHQLRANPHFSKTTLIALTGFSNLALGEQARAAGFDAFFRKPMDFEVLEQFKRA